MGVAESLRIKDKSRTAAGTRQVISGPTRPRATREYRSVSRMGRRVLWGSAFGAVAWAAWSWWHRRVPSPPDAPAWGPAPFPFPPVPRPPGTTPAATTATEAGSGTDEPGRTPS